MKFVVPPLPSARVRLPIDSVGPSSLTIVPVPVAVLMVALPGLDRLTVKVWSGAPVVGPGRATGMVAGVLPAAMVSVPAVGVKSVPAVAVPLPVLKTTVVLPAAAAD